MSRVLPYFKPLHKAVSFHCNICGRLVGETEYHSQRVREIISREEGGDMIFCDRCNEIAEEVSRTITEFETREREKFEKHLAKERSELAEHILSEKGLGRSGSGGHSEPPPSSTKKGRKATNSTQGSRDRRPASIPNPTVGNA